MEWDDSDGSGRRELACRECLPDLVVYAHLCESFRPPMVAPIDLDLHREWAVSA